MSKRARRRINPNIVFARISDSQGRKGATLARYLFIQWFAFHRIEFGCQITYRKAPGGGLTIRFVGATNAIEASLHANGISVIALVDGQYIDSLIDFDIYPEKVGSGFVCGLSPDTEAVPALWILWQKVVFEPFRQWVRDKLLPAHWLNFVVVSEGCSSAKIVVDEVAGLRHQESFKRLLEGLVPVGGLQNKEAVNLNLIRNIPIWNR